MFEEYHCQICCSGRLEEVHGFKQLPRITSDCKPFRPGGHLVECIDCGAVQALPSALWFSEISEIYAQYTHYYQSGGLEQVVFDSHIGALRCRSDVILSHLNESGALPTSGRVLDVGCGNGMTLRRLSTERPGLQLYAQDIDDKGREHLDAIPNFKRYYTCQPVQIDGEFDLVTLIHSLEHFPSPFSVLEQLHSKVSGTGQLFIQVPNALENPFELVVADHLMHFMPGVLAQIIERAGFKIDILETAWVTKELSLLASLASDKTREPNQFSSLAKTRFAKPALCWLQSVIDDATTCAHKSHVFGILGTSIAATWLASALDGKVSFFVDEDPSCQCREHMDRPVFALNQVPRDAQVFLALAPKVAKNVSKRLAAQGIRFVSPRPIEFSVSWF